MTSNIFTRLQISFGMKLIVVGVVFAAIAGWQKFQTADPGPLTTTRVSNGSSGAEGVFYTSRPIETLKPGDQVLAFDPESGQHAWKTVERNLRRVTDHLRILTIREAISDREQIIKTTDEHPFWVEEAGWTKAGDLTPSDPLRLASGGSATLIATRREEHPERVTVFNVTIQDYHTYFVSQDAAGPPVLVHNAKLCDEAAEAAAAAAKKAPVKPGQTGDYGDLKAQKKKFGETEPMHMDHQPSFAAQKATKEEALGRRLTKTEIAQLKASTPAVASPKAVHTGTSPTFGGRNTPEQIAEDAADMSAAAARDRAAFDAAMKNR